MDKMNNRYVRFILFAIVILFVLWVFVLVHKPANAQTPLNMGYPTDNGTMNFMMEKWCSTKLGMIIDLQMITSKMPEWEKYRFSRSATRNLEKLSEMKLDEEWLNDVACSATQYPHY